MDVQSKDKNQRPQFAKRENPAEPKKQLLILGEADDGDRDWGKNGTSILGGLQKSSGNLSD